jgi:RNA:NAD 2'-phosphotransferase (TPT1/KptA family)
MLNTIEFFRVRMLRVTHNLIPTVSTQTKTVSNLRNMASTSRGKKRGGYGRRRNEDPDVVLSKTLSNILRHNAHKEGLDMRPDGYVKLDELVRHRRVRLFG